LGGPGFRGLGHALGLQGMESGRGRGSWGGSNDRNAKGLQAEVLAIGDDESVGSFDVDAAPKAVGGSVLAIGLALRREDVGAALGQVERKDAGAFGGVDRKGRAEAEGAAGKHSVCDCCIVWDGRLNLLNSRFTGRLQ